MIKHFEDVYDLNSVTLNVTNKCNLNCSYCFEHKKNNQMMTSQIAIDIARKCYKKLDSKIGRFTFNIFGGEPLLNWPVIKDMIDFTNKNHYICKFGITTNLTTLNDEIINYIDDNDIMMLVSIDGIGHDKNRCNTYKTVKANIKKLVDKGLGFLIEARMTITPEYGKYLYESVKEVIELGINNICPICVSDTEWTDEQIADLKTSYMKLLDYYCSILDDKDNKRNISIKYVDELLGMLLEPMCNDSRLMCHIGSKQWCAIDTNGDVYPCHNCPTSDKDYIKDMKIGNIYTGIDTDKMYEDDIVANFNRKECENCIGKSICKSGCPLQNLTCNHNMQVPTEAHCKIFRMYAESIKEFQEKLLKSTNSRSRYLNLIKENLKVKKYMDSELLTTPLRSLDFLVKLDRFQEMYDSLNAKGNVIPSFDKYFKLNIAAIASWTIAEKECKSNG